MMIRKQDGFTLVELMVTMVVFVVVITAASNIFSGLLNQFKQQTKIAETNIEGVIGLELLRADVEQAGFGLPWDMNSSAYNEAANDPNTLQDETAYNDVVGGVSNPPRAIVLGQGAGLNGSDVLVLKATNVATNAAAHKWTYIINTGGGANTIQAWNAADDNLNNNDRVIVLLPVNRQIVTSGGAFYTLFNTAPGTFDAAFQPVANSFNANLVYGVDTAGVLRMPFNRADYYVRRPGAGMPTRCEATTGNLYKAIVNQADGGLTEMPLLDCVLDMRVVVGADTGTVAVPAPTTWTVMPAADPAAAETIRNQTRDVRVYIVAHEGQRDTSYTYTNPNAALFPGTCDQPAQLCIFDVQNGVTVLLNARTLTADQRNFRWKIYTLVATPYNLR